MNSQEAYSINLAGDIYSYGNRIFYAVKTIENKKYASYIMELLDEPKKLTFGNSERLPSFIDETLYYIKYDDKSETLIKIEKNSEPQTIAVFKKIKKYIIAGGLIFIIAMEDADPKEPFVAEKIKYRFNGTGLFRKRYSLYKVDKNLSKIYSGNFDVEDIAYNGKRLLIQTTENHDDYGLSDIYEIDFNGNKIKRITEKSLVIHGFNISESGRIALSGHYDLDPWKINYIIFPEEKKEIRVENDSYDSILTDMFFTRPYKLKFYRDRLYFIGQNKSTSNLYSLFNYSIKKETEIDGKIMDFDISEDGIPVFVYTDNEHPSIIKYKNEFDLNENIKGYKAQRILLDSGEIFFMFRDENAPTIVFIHGGPQTAYGNIYYIEFQYLYSNGYNILFTNPPGSTGYGKDYETECVGDWGGKDFEYIKKAMETVKEKYKLKNDFAVTGGSYGGFMTNWIVSHSDIFKCAISERSISNMLSMIGTSDIGFWFNTLQLKIDDPYSPDGMKKLMEYSPITYVKNVKTPVLLITGEEDYRCPIEQAEQFFVGLKLNNIDSELIRYPGDNHEHARSGIPSNMIDRLEKKLQWFNKYMKK